MKLALAHRARMALFDLDREAARLDVRGFASTSPEKREPLEASGMAFVDGYRAAIRMGDARRTSEACEEIPLLLRGFAYEGAAMGLTLLDLFTTAVPRRFRTFLHERGAAHAYMVHVGAGWAIARCPWGAATFLPKLDPIFKWLTVDGIGFHAGFFHPTLYDRQGSALLRRCGPDAFDAGLGRALWFAAGAQPARAIRCIEAFAPARRPSLWSGLGLAVTYAGGASDEDLVTLAGAAGGARPYLAQGAAFAAKARQRAGNPAAHTERACRLLCQLSAADAAALTDQCLARLPVASDTFDRWRQMLADVFASTLDAGAPVSTVSSG